MIGEEDLAVFYDPADFAHVCTRRRSGVPDVTFPGLMGEQDGEALDGHALTTVRRLQYPTATVDLREGDQVLIGAATYRARDVRLVTDGQESTAQLTKVSA